ncbi:hypothetical protein JST97_00175 [bacterium]|nr:hypothetical protein [bacterium]
MKPKTFLLGCAALCLLPSLALADVPGVDKATLGGLDKEVGKVMDGYNANNWKAFYNSSWAQQTKAIQTEQTFNTLYSNMYLKQYGTLKSRKVLDSASSFGPMNAVLIYEASFSKKAGKLAVNFFKEGGKWKIQQLQVAP